MEKIIATYLQHEGVPVSKTFVEDLISSHPNYPSILSVSDTFDQLGLESVFGRTTEDQLHEIPFPFILHFSPNEFVEIRNKKTLNNITGLLSRWEGVIIKAEKNKIESNLENKKIKLEESISLIFFISLILLFTLGFLSLVLSNNITQVSKLWSFTSIIGFSVGLVLQSKEIGVRSSSLDKFCRHGKDFNCDKVLTSKAAEIFRPLKLSDLVLSYFAFQLILLFAFFNSKESILVLEYMPIFSLPLVGYSFYSQKVTFKSWCTLCLLTSSILIGQLILTLFFGQTSGFFELLSSFSLLTGLNLLLIFTSLTTMIFVVRRWISKLNSLRKRSHRYQRIALNEEVFCSLILKQKSLVYDDDMPYITIGNPNASIELTLVASLKCNSCGEAYSDIYGLIKACQGTVKARIIFHQEQKANDKYQEALEHLFKIWKEESKNRAISIGKIAEAIQMWYSSDGNLKKLLMEYPTDNSHFLSNKEKPEYPYNINWLKNNGINISPMVFVNGFILPSEYELKDLSRLFQLIDCEQLANKIESSGKYWPMKV